eukprot:1078226-Rhodomonas_salina.1
MSAPDIEEHMCRTDGLLPQRGLRFLGASYADVSACRGLRIGRGKYFTFGGSVVILCCAGARFCFKKTGADMTGGRRSQVPQERDRGREQEEGDSERLLSVGGWGLER